jgi:hypothetical protein
MDKDELAKAKQNLKAAARKEAAKSGLLQFRCDPEIVEQFYSIAESRKIPVSVLLRS